MAQNILEIGSKITSKVKEESYGQMELTMKETFPIIKGKDKVSLYGKTEAFIMETLEIINLMVKVLKYYFLGYIFLKILFNENRYLLMVKWKII